ncbi:tryptophan-rich sensory protein [Bacillus idriensis]|uniref:Tryptophan-rich sensory protein n=1 Tax=Metabacillus idriensis TaxID=324768 RepID=A0A6I2M4X2_9BACI|nr:TspO/MBR family protein [Metabacillus idriensis]MRX53168.1 tryptophan-rich sensory protein [Metabacillus idriensis]
MKRFSVLALINVIGYILVIAVNYLANAQPINGQTTGEVSDSIPVLFTPAGYAFSIWGLIYLLLGIWVVRQFFVKDEERKIIEKIGYWFFISCLFNSLWIFVFHYELFRASLIVMLGLLISLIRVYIRIQSSPDPKWLMRTPFSIYLGWISVETIVNFFIFFYTNGIESFLGLNELAWTIIVLVVGAVLAVWFTFKNNDIYYPLVFIWAYIAIYVNQDPVAIKRTAVVTVIVIAAAVLLNIIRMIRNKK